MNINRIAAGLSLSPTPANTDQFMPPRVSGPRTPTAA